MDAPIEDIANIMQIECSGCAARYDVPDEVVRPRRMMRCARCGETWVPQAAELEASLASEPDFAGDATVAAPDAPISLPPSAMRGGVALTAAWIGTVLLLLVAAWAFWHFRVRIGQVWPPSRRLLG